MINFDKYLFKNAHFNGFFLGSLVVYGSITHKREDKELNYKILVLAKKDTFKFCRK